MLKKSFSHSRSGALAVARVDKRLGGFGEEGWVEVGSCNEDAPQPIRGKLW